MASDLPGPKQIEKEIKESKKFLQTIIETEPECVKLLNADGSLIMMNGAGLAMIQADSLEQVKGRSIYPLVLPEYREAFKTITREVFQGKSGTLTFEMMGIKGRRLWLETHAVPLRNDKDEIIALLGITRDVTAGKQTEEVLKKERDFTAAVLETVGAMVLVLDRGGKIVRFNRTCEEVSGYKVQEVLGKHVWDFLLSPDQVEPVKQVFKNLVSGMFPNKYENYWMTKDGGKRLIAWSNTALLAPDGSVEFVIPTGIDITERKRADEALLQEKRFSDAIIDSLPGAFYICDENGRLIRWNNNEKEVTGYSMEELMNMNVLELFKEDRTVVEKAMREVFVTGRATVEARLVTKSGTAIPFFLSGLRMSMDQRKYLVGVGLDISERKRLEEQLRHAQKIESIGTLAGGIAHDFNNILTAIIGYGNLLNMKMPIDDPLRHNVDQILSSAGRAAQLTQGLLAYSRKQIINPQPVDLNELVRKLERFLARLIGEDVELMTALTDKDATVQADSGQIEQVLMNLATNARDAMPDGGILHIDTDRIDLDDEFARAHPGSRPGKYVLISVTDSGVGMDENTREKIFEPFFTTKEVGKGTGLGLSMVYGIVKQHNGYITVASGVGKGTTFSIYLPAVQAEITQAKLLDTDSVKEGTETILVAEDDEAIRGLAKDMLEEFGYTVILAEDGEDAVNKFRDRSDTIQLLLLDMIMPKKNGKEVYEEIKGMKPDIKAIFLSGYTADLIQKRGVLEEGLNFIVKPFAINALLDEVRLVLDS
jgi:PAS domain S-box-containing protein